MLTSQLIEAKLEELRLRLESRRLTHIDQMQEKTIYKLTQNWSNDLYIAFQDGTWIYITAETNSDGGTDLSAPNNHTWHISWHINNLIDLGVLSGEERQRYETLMNAERTVRIERQRTQDDEQLLRLVRNNPTLTRSLLEKVEHEA